jgi:predicted acyl esterase
MAGHAAPAASAAEQRSKLDEQLAFMDHALKGTRLRTAPVVWWTRDGAVTVPGNAYKYPDNAWFRQSGRRWPPSGTQAHTFAFGSGTAPLAPVAEDERNDPVAMAAFSASPLGTAVVPGSLPPTNVPGAVATLATGPFADDTELAGAPSARLAWTPSGPDSQLVLKLYDLAPDGTTQVITRGVTGIRGAALGRALNAQVSAKAVSWLLRAGHRLVACVMDGDAGFYKPYAGQAGGLLDLGASALSVPLRDLPRAPH